MEPKNRERQIVEPNPAAEPEIGRWLWAAQDGRGRTLRELARLTPRMIDWRPPGNESSIGTVLFHMAAIEADWLYVEVLEQPFPPEVDALFPYPLRDEQGELTQIPGFSLEEHVGRLEMVRGRLLAAYGAMGLGEYRRVRSFPDYDVTPEWVLHHMMQHEAEHRGQIGAMRARAERELGEIG